MDDQYLYATASGGRKFRAYTFDSKCGPPGSDWWRYRIETFMPDEGWCEIETSYFAWRWANKETHHRERLQWWAEHATENEVAQRIANTKSWKPRRVKQT